MNDIVKSEQTAVVANNQQQSVLDIIGQMAQNPNVDVAKMQAMLEMQERIMAKQAEINFNQAMARISQKMPRIVKGGSVSYKDKDSGKMQEAFKFARYEDIDEVVRPLLVEEGFSLSYSTDQREGGGVVMHGTLSHKDGHSRTASIPLALDLSGGKNNIQGMGSTSSYGRRYTMCMLLNIVTVGEDDDGKGADPVIDTEAAAFLDNEIRSFGADFSREGFLKFMGVAALQDIKLSDYPKAINALNAKKKAAIK